MADDPAAYWNEQAGPRWITMQPQLDAFLLPVTARLLDVAAVQPHEDVIDVGCGFGSTCMLLAERARSVVGVDISEPMLSLARTRSDLPFELGDAQTHAFTTASADLIFSRFGVMFFEDSTLAFRNLRGALRPGGRFVFATWQPRECNPWMTQLVDSLVELDDVDTSVPGPFRFEDPDRARGVLQDAGFDEVKIDSFETPLGLRGTPEELLAFWLKVGPLAGALEAADDPKQALASVKETLRALHDGTGIFSDAAVWVVQAS